MFGGLRVSSSPFVQTDAVVAQNWPEALISWDQRQVGHGWCEVDCRDPMQPKAGDACACGAGSFAPRQPASAKNVSDFPIAIDAQHASFRIFWIFICVSVMIYFIVQVTLSILKYQKHSTTTDVQVIYTSEVLFPAVTLCNQNNFRSALVCPLLEICWRLLETIHGKKFDTMLAGLQPRTTFIFTITSTTFSRRQQVRKTLVEARDIICQFVKYATRAEQHSQSSFANMVVLRFQPRRPRMERREHD